MTGRCPYCGAHVQVARSLTYRHPEDNVRGNRPCPGSRQHPRGYGDGRPTWRDEERAGRKWDPYKGVDLMARLKESLEEVDL